LPASACGIVKISWKARTSSGATMPSALAIFADSAITATENATLRRVSGIAGKHSAHGFDNAGKGGGSGFANGVKQAAEQRHGLSSYDIRSQKSSMAQPHNH
jgi:hypothetical protein